MVTMFNKENNHGVLKDYISTYVLTSSESSIVTYEEVEVSVTSMNMVDFKK
jgi:hypothetical protein